MQLLMAGIDHGTAPLGTRERFSLGEEGCRRALGLIGAEVEGGVLLSTCNRTELYLTVSDGASLSPEEALCRGAGVSAPQEGVVSRSGREAAEHLMMVACGLCSRLVGEDQILAQVKRALTLAREESACDAVLETLFRSAVTAAKRVKTEYPSLGGNPSAAASAVELLCRELGGLRDQRVLVIGNGVVGRRSAELLVKAGCKVTVTTRSYRHGTSFIPTGCDAVPYAERYSVIAGFDAVVSATASPHHTLVREKLAAGCPPLLADLAVPRDIDPAAAELPGVRLWDVDRLTGGRGMEIPPEALGRILEIQREQFHRFSRWMEYRKKLREKVL